ncbi:MAG: SufE family protein [Bacteroidetes bacterium]|nr:Fe-S metabolism protein SufE [Rhodothermaceae bacterium RA]RMH50973.1 MAG: SufE family protein [Bacteroidota bacterium]
MTTLDALADELRFADDAMRLEILLEYADRLPPLPEAYHALRDAGLNRVDECQAPVFLMVDVVDGKVKILADVPEEAPTARSFVALLLEAFNDQPPSVVAEAPPDILHRLGLTGLLGMQRTRGLSAIYQRIKHEVARKTEASS